jgi:hypothetical protein
MDKDMDRKYKIVFSGELKPGHDLISIKSRLGSMFGVSASVVEMLFLGKPVLVKVESSLDAAHLFKMDFEKTGASCRIEEV